jgi:hypothetical protein
MMEHIINKGGRLPTLNTKHLLGRTFITNPDFIGVQRRAKIEDIEATGEKALDGKQPLFKFWCKVGDERFEEIVTYNRMLEWVEQDQDKDDFFRIVGIKDHKRIQGKWYVLIRWASGLTSWNSLATTKADDPITVAMYAKRNNLLDTDGWGGLKKLVRNTKMLGGSDDWWKVLEDVIMGAGVLLDRPGSRVSRTRWVSRKCQLEHSPLVQ